MPRDGLGQYSPPPGTNGITNFTIESTKYNGFVSDITADLNAARPIVAGGTAATTVDGALDNLSAEKFKQVVTDWSSNVWRAGSFYAATTATGAAPIPGKAFAGIAYYANATDFVIEATNLTDPGGMKYIRTQTAGVWSGWATVGTTRKNYTINGAMMISQENGIVAGSANLYHPADQFRNWTAGTTGVVSWAQIAVPTPGGSPNRIRGVVTTPDASVGSTDIYYIGQLLEGVRVSDLKAGTASPKTITIQFGVKAPAGTYCVTVDDGITSTRCYVSQYVISAGEANTDVVKSVTLTLDTTGPWISDNRHALTIQWMLMCGSNYQKTPNAWVSGGGGNASSSQFNFLGTNGNIFELFDVSLTEGTVAPPFQVPDYASELALCRRYFRHIGYGVYAEAETGTGLMCNYTNDGALRAAPTATAIQPTIVVRRHLTQSDIPLTVASNLDMACTASGGRYFFTITGGPFTVGERFIIETENILKLSARL